MFGLKGLLRARLLIGICKLYVRKNRGARPRFLLIAAKCAGFL